MQNTVRQVADRRKENEHQWRIKLMNAAMLMRVFSVTPTPTRIGTGRRCRIQWPEDRHDLREGAIGASISIKELVLTWTPNGELGDSDPLASPGARRVDHFSKRLYDRLFLLASCYY